MMLADDPQRWPDPFVVRGDRSPVVSATGTRGT
jgi:hypothetical protein